MFGLTSKKGFTLIELLIAITIIGILSATLIPRIANVLPTARDGARKASINDVVAAVEAYNLDYGNYPPTAFCLTETATNPIDTANKEKTETGYTVGDFLNEYLRDSAPTFQEVSKVSSCKDSITYTRLDTNSYILAVPVELGKNGNSTKASELAEPATEDDPATEDIDESAVLYHVVVR